MPFRPSVLAAGLLSTGLGILILLYGFEPLLPVSQRMAWEKEFGFWRNGPFYLRYGFGILEGLFKGFLQLHIGKALFLIIILCTAPWLMALFLEGNKGCTHPIMSSWLPFMVVNAGQIRGLGVVASLTVPLIYAITKILEPVRHDKCTPPTQRYVLATFALHMLVLASSITLAFWPLDHPLWPKINLQFQISTVVLLPLVLWPTAKPRSGTLPHAATLLGHLKPLFTVGWFVLVGYALYALLVLRERINDAVLVIIWDNVGSMVTFFGLVAVDWANGDARSQDVSKVLEDFALVGPPAAICEWYVRKEERAIRRAKGKKKR